MTTPTPTTELDAVNLMLSSIGEAPVNNISNTSNPDVLLARATLAECSRLVQSRRWHFNTEKGLELYPTLPTGEIQIPPNVMRVDTVENSKHLDVVHRGTRLYDRGNHRYIFIAPIKVDLLLFLPFGELPEAARYAIAVKAARKFQARALGSTALFSFTELDEREAMIILEEAEADTADLNMFTGNTTVASGISRYRRF